MNDDFEAGVRERLRERARASDLDITTLAAYVDQLPTRRRTFLPAWAQARTALASLVTVVAVGVVVVAALFNRESLVGPTPAVSAPSVASPSSSRPSLITAWTEIPLEATIGTGRLTDLVPFAGGFVAVGQTGTGGDRTLAVWRSTDAVHWSPTATIGPAPTDVVGLARSEDGSTLVAIGIVQGERAMAWTSSDGTAWRAFELGVPAAGHPVHLEAVVADNAGFLITGSYETDTGGEAWPAGIDPLAPLLWTSRGGKTWTQATIPGSDIRVETIAAGTTGFIAGGARRSGTSFVPTVWTSADGQAWSSAIDLPDGQTGVAGEYLSVNAIGVATDGIVAVSGRTGHQAIGRVWSSIDGVHWWRVADLGSADPRIYAIGSTPAGFVAAGLSGEDPVDQTLVLIESTDGASWKRLVTEPARSGETPRAPVSDGSRIVLIVAGQTLLVGPLSP